MVRYRFLIFLFVSFHFLTSNGKSKTTPTQNPKIKTSHSTFIHPFGQFSNSDLREPSERNAKVPSIHPSIHSGAIRFDSKSSAALKSTCCVLKKGAGIHLEAVGGAAELD